MLRKIKVLLLTVILVSPFHQAKGEKFFKLQLSSSNGWIDMLSVGASSLINKNGNIFDNYLSMNAFLADSDNDADQIHVMSNSDNLRSIGSFKFPELLNGLSPGIKIGYMNPKNRFLQNFHLYGCLNVTYNYFNLNVAEPSHLFEAFDNSIIKVSPGIGGNVELGNPGSNYRLTIDMSVRYDLPVFYKGKLGENSGCLNSGFSPRVELILGGFKMKTLGMSQREVDELMNMGEKKKLLGMNVGIFFEWTAYNMFKPSKYFTEPYTMKAYTMGINFTINYWWSK